MFAVVRQCMFCAKNKWAWQCRRGHSYGSESLRAAGARLHSLVYLWAQSVIEGPHCDDLVSVWKQERIVACAGGLVFSALPW